MPFKQQPFSSSKTEMLLSHGFSSRSAGVLFFFFRRMVPHSFLYGNRIHTFPFPEAPVIRRALRTFFPHLAAFFFPFFRDFVFFPPTKSDTTRFPFCFLSSRVRVFLWTILDTSPRLDVVFSFPAARNDDFPQFFRHVPFSLTDALCSSVIPLHRINMERFALHNPVPFSPPFWFFYSPKPHFFVRFALLQISKSTCFFGFVSCAFILFTTPQNRTPPLGCFIGLSSSLGRAQPPIGQIPPFHGPLLAFG